MSLTLAAVGAVATALLELSVVPYLRIGGAQPDLVLILAVILAIVAGIDRGLAAAFVGGLTIDFLAPRPLGSTAFVLLVAVGGAAALGRLFARARSVATIVAVFVLSIAGSLLFLGVYGVLRGPVPTEDPFGIVLPQAVYNALITVVAGPLATAAHRRYFERERIDW